MKRKIGEIRNMPIVEGDKNLVREGTEIHINDLQSKGSSSGGGSSKYAPRYFNIDFNVADEGWKHLLTFENSDNPINQDNILINIGASYKIIMEGLNRYITSYPFYLEKLNCVTQFSYIPLYIPDSIPEIKGGFLTFEDIITNMPTILRIYLEKDVTLSMKGITEITEEEFYKID